MHTEHKLKRQFTFGNSDGQPQANSYRGEDTNDDDKPVFNFTSYDRFAIQKPIAVAQSRGSNV